MRYANFAKLILISIFMATSSLLFAQAENRKPNIIYILADDLGYSELGCYGQTKIKTPNIDKIAAEGMKFTQHYSGSTVCAPSRCTFLTGLHTGHAHVRGNKGRPVVGQLPIPAETVTIPQLLKEVGYATGCVGKWGLGGPDTTGLPNKQGFDFFFGFLDQWRAHNHYPTYLYKNNEKFLLNNHDFKSHQRIKEPFKTDAEWKKFQGKDYAGDRMGEQCLEFIKQNKDNPFFLYFASPVPHVSIQIPDDSLAEYDGKFPETPYLGTMGYLPHPKPRAAYAAMITRMDRDVGRIMKLLKELGIDDNTLVIFTSDNGPTFNGGSDSKFFESAGPFKGLKTEVYEGGIRIPFIARWPKIIAAGSTSDHLSAFWDMMPTFTELAGAKTPKNTDGISMLPTLLGNPKKTKTTRVSLLGRCRTQTGDPLARL